MQLDDDSLLALYHVHDQDGTGGGLGVGGLGGWGAWGWGLRELGELGGWGKVSRVGVPCIPLRVKVAAAKAPPPPPPPSHPLDDQATWRTSRLCS
jgi:hypothetical protein